MRQRGLLVIAVLVGCCYCCCYGQDVNGGQLEKQEGLVGLQTCIDGFVVHRDKIIRTQDSMDMGAKYLTEFDVESRIECMKWCCEKEHCDVFIYEEKKPGSCYLFHCGPPQDFKCKFMSHANYSSAVLTNYNMQNTAALEEQIRRNQQEHELKSLRKMEPPPKEYREYITGAPISTSTTSTPSPTSTSTVAAPVKIPVCSRNQFECRSNDDCIAIYNVCDGIPQCADGSDEAAELGCPVDRSTLPPQPPPPPPVIVPSPKPYIPLLPEVIRYQQMMQQQQQHGQYPMVYPGGREQDASKGWPMVNPNLHQLSSNQELSYGRGYNPQQMLDESNAGPSGMAHQAPQQHHQQVQVPPPQAPSIQHQQQQQQQQQQHQLQPQLPVNFKPSGYSQWNNYPEPVYEQNANKLSDNAALNVMHAQNALPSAYEHEQPPRIFNHKGPNMRMEDIEAANAGMYGQDLNRGYAPYYPSVMHHVPQDPNSWQEVAGPPPQQQQVQVIIATPSPPHEQHHQEQSKKHADASTSAPPCDSEEKKDDDVAKDQNGLDKKSQNDEAHKKLHSTSVKVKDTSDEHSADHRESKSAAENKKADNHKAHEAELRTMAMEAHLQEHKSMPITDHIRRHSTKLEDLEMSRPKGAVISLALGLTVTAVMAVLIACRLRVVKRRGRGRGHDSYAHDADYLVNGMYL